MMQCGIKLRVLINRPSAIPNLTKTLLRANWLRRHRKSTDFQNPCKDFRDNRSSQLFTLALLAIVLFSQIPISYAEAKEIHPDSNLSSTSFQEAKSIELPKKVYFQIAQNQAKIKEGKVDPGVLSSNGDMIEVLIETTAGYKNTDLKYVQKSQMQEFRLGKFVYMKVLKSEINKLEKINSVKKVQLDAEYKPLLDVAVPLINANSFLTNNFNGSGIKVCVLDTGVNKTHPALISRVIAEKDFVTTDGDGDNPEDFYGHGTHVAGIVASTDSTYRGVAFGSSILNAKVFSSTSGSALTSDIMSGIDWCISQGANILTLSLGGQDEQNDGSDELSQYVDLAVDKGKIVTIAAGNSGPSGGNTYCRTSKSPTGSSYSICAPALSHKGITVGSTQTNKSITGDGLSGFSSRGPTSDLRIKPDVAAPGEWITSANAGYLSGTLWTTLRGTSMAAPMVAGLSALILQARNMSPEEVKTLLMNSAVDLGSPGKDNSYGAGSVNASRVFDEINNTVRNTMDDSGYKIHNIFVPSGSKEIRATLYWPENYSSHNDVDLYLLDPAGNISASSLSSDNTDEMVKLSNPSPAGNWKLLVDPFSVNGNQIYSLASNFKPSEQMYLDTANISDKIVYHQINVTNSSKTLIVNLDWNFTNADLAIYLYNTSGYLVNQSIGVNTNYEEVSVNAPEYGMWLVRLVPVNLGTHTEISYSLSSTFIISQQILDSIAPNVTLIEPINKTYNAQNINSTFRVIENLNTFVDCYGNLDDTTNFSDSIQTTSLSAHNFSVSDGVHNISVTCIDTANNLGNSSLIYFTVDTTAPDVTPVLPVPGARLSVSNVTFNFTATDATLNLSCNLSIDGAINKAFSATNGSNAVYATNSFTDGNYNWSVSCRDGVGNANDTITARNFTVDTIPPSVSDVKITPKYAKPNSNVTLIAAIDDSSSVNAAYLVVYNSSWDERIPRQNLSRSGKDWFLTFNISDSPAGIYYFNITATDTNNKVTAWVGNLSVNGTAGAANSFTNTSVPAQDGHALINAIHDTNVSLQIRTTDQSTSTAAIVAISSYAENPGTENAGVPALNKYLEITTSSGISSALSWALIEVHYDDSDVPPGYAEANLRIYYFNETSRSWAKYDGPLMGGVNTTGNHVWANTTHFSIYGVFIGPTCNDGIQNQEEGGVDCGGPSCSACYSPPPSNPPSASSVSVSGGGGGSGSGSGSGFNYLSGRGKLSIFGYPSYMNAKQGEQVSYIFTIKNVGNATLHDVKLAISGMDSSWFLLEPGTVISELKADGAQVFTLKVRPPADTVPQKYSLTLNATSDENSLDVVSSTVFEVVVVVLEKAKAEPARQVANVNPVNDAKPETEARTEELPPVTITELTPIGSGIGLSLVWGSGLLFWRTARRRRHMHKLHATHAVTVTANRSGGWGKEQQRVLIKGPSP